MPTTRHTPRPTGRAHRYHGDHRTMQVTHTPYTYDPDTDVDWIAVERAANGTYDPTLLSLTERRHAVLLMLRHGYGAPTISERLATYERTIQRWRDRANAVDFSLVEKAINGRLTPSRLSRAELREAVLLMLDNGHTPREINLRLGIAPWETRAWEREERQAQKTGTTTVLDLPKRNTETTLQAA